jgi:cell pole-organizing protein PopZ
MSHGQKPAESNMEDVLASIRRAIDENANGSAQGRLGGSMAEFRVKFDAPANQENRSRSRYERVSPAASPSTQGFAGILAGKNDHAAASATRDGFKPREPIQRRLDPAPPRSDDGQKVYDGYYAAQVVDYTAPARKAEPYQTPAPAGPTRYLPLPRPIVAGQPVTLPPPDALMSEASSDATQVAFARLAETLARRALGEHPIADIAQEMVRGMLKQWLDDNLPKIVERLVREEIERVVRRPR